MEKKELEFVMKSFMKMANIDDYFESLSNGEIGMSSSKERVEIKISKPKKEEFPEFLNVNIVNKSEKLKIDIVANIIIDMCERLELMDNKLKMKFDILMGKRSNTIIIDGKEYKLG